MTAGSPLSDTRIILAQHSYVAQRTASFLVHGVVGAAILLILWRDGRASKHSGDLPLILAALLACGDAPDGAKDSARASDTGGAAGAGTDRAPADLALERAARQAVGFLRGEVPADALALADTVEIRVAPEGGGAARRVPRQALAERASWAVAVGGRRVALAPPAVYSSVSTSVGRHFNCQEQDLASRAPDLATRPHVGVRLQPDSAASCLLMTSPRYAWPGCLKDQLERRYQPPGLVILLRTSREVDSTAVHLSAQTVRPVPPVVIDGDTVDIALPLQLCSITTILGVIDSLVGR